ncbi:glycoside hydrolase family 35 protein [Hymenopellis radicata]|nr:glycoside hydrolase family 35 protein [Hymenopellis radicata]
MPPVFSRQISRFSNWVQQSTEGEPRAILSTRPSDDFMSRAVSFTDEVSFDNYSLFLHSQRTFIYSGEFHTFRLPVPDLWPDILQKVKAAGLNSVSVYTHMGLLNPSRGVVDFDGYRSLKTLYEAALEAGIWLVMRPGALPYINAETSAGGIAHWATTEVAGRLRSNDSDWREAWQDYVLGFIEETSPYQITEGGPVIDNEFQQAIGDTYFQDLEDVYHASAIVVPLTYNDPNQGANFINGTGAVDLYGLDSYPQSFDCSRPTVWKNVTTNYHDYHERVNPAQPYYFPEFQGGAFDPWGPNAPGYANCGILTGADFMSVFYRQLWAANAKLMSYYMIYGGTSWGAIPFPAYKTHYQVYTSYDYGATISEGRTLGSKYDELKRQGFFIRSSPEFYKTDWIADSATGLAVTSNAAIFATYLRNPDSGSGFYILRHNDSTSTAVTDFDLSVSTSQGDVELTALTLNGRQSKVVVADYTFGSSSRVSYSTASIYYASVIDERDVILFFGDKDQSHEFSMQLTGTSLGGSDGDLLSGFSITTSGDNSVVSVAAGVEPGIVTIHDSHTQLVLFADTVTASSFFSPIIPGDSSNPFRTFWGLGTNESILVGGPYLVRTADILEGSTLALTGDLNSSTTVAIVASSSVHTVTWNGVKMKTRSGLTGKGGFVAELPFAGTEVSVPVLEGWKFKDSLPEIGSGFDDGDWVMANHTTTNIPQKPYYGDGRILYGCDYGFCENIVLWRGHFNATGAEKSVNLSINGGEAFAASVWLNDVFLNTSYGNSTNNQNKLEETDDLFTFPDGALVEGDNVITIVQDNMGLNETRNTDSSKNPRGVRGFKLDVGNFSDWKVQGKVGGYTGYPDKVRGVFNEGGLFGERSGWHLPGFDTSTWESRELSDGLPGSACWRWGLGQPYRVYLFVNGWMMGKRVANLGPQAKFPVHEGILDYSGTNTVAIALWAMEENVILSPNLQLVVDGVYEGGVGKISTNNPGWSAAGRVVRDHEEY